MHFLNESLLLRPDDNDVFLKDLEGWCTMSDFELPEESQSSELLRFRLEGSTLQELSKGSKGELIPISPGGATPPSILSRRSRRRIALSPDPDDSMTPKSTPVKILPFSPSQVPQASFTSLTYFCLITLLQPICWLIFGSFFWLVPELNSFLFIFSTVSLFVKNSAIQAKSRKLPCIYFLFF